ncbi:hypothetical protein DIZ76_012290 [Coccidioides immitis]|nr:hypothetical protein DIZ76_012290 [Coccidioides immitis]
MKALTKRVPTADSLRLSLAASTEYVKSWISSTSTAYDPLYFENETPRKPADVKGWPTEPGPLKKSGAAYFVRLVCDILAVAATFPFLLLGIYAAQKHGKPVVEKEWATLQESMKVAVTSFPIVFSAVMGRMTRTAATWRLERGVELGQVEQLFWSSTVFSTVSTQFLLGSFNKLTIGLLVLWALSPLGGQSSLRIVGTAARPEISKANITVLNTEKLSFFEIGGDILAGIPTLNGLYLTALMAPHDSKVSPADLWGNVKVPLMSSFGSSIKANSSGWYDINQHEVLYSSLIGVPTIGLSQIGNSTFNMETSYFDIDCHNLTQAEPVSLERNITFKTHKDTPPPRVVRFPGGAYIGSNGTEDCSKHNCQISFSLGMSHYVKDWSYPSGNSTLFRKVKGNEETILSSPPTLLFQARHSNKTVAYCGIKRVFVESAVTCVGDPSLLRKPQCAVTATRDSLRPHEPSDITPFLFAGTFINFSSRLAQSAGQGHAGIATITERYLNNTENPLLAEAREMALHNLPINAFSQRLTQIINTYFLPSLLPEGIVGNISLVLSQTPVYQEQSYAHDSWTRSVPATVNTPAGGIYVVSGGWMTVFIVSSLVMFVAAVLSAIVAHRTSIPDVLGYVSSLTRDAIYFPLPNGGSRLDGLERSRILKDRLVRLGDVQGTDNRAGHLAFAEAKAAMPAKKGRFYG